VFLRKDLDIFASISRVQNMEGVQSRHKNVDFAIIRENTEGEYSGLEHQVFWREYMCISSSLLLYEFINLYLFLFIFLLFVPAMRVSS